MTTFRKALETALLHIAEDLGRPSRPHQRGGLAAAIIAALPPEWQNPVTQDQIVAALLQVTEALAATRADADRLAEAARMAEALLSTMMPDENYPWARSRDALRDALRQHEEVTP